MKKIVSGEVIPFGWSFSTEKGFIPSKSYFLKFRLWSVNSSKYDISYDEMRYKKWTLGIILALYFVNSGFGLRISKFWY